ncbi:MAG: (d)CMP kinase [Flavobacteriaceae bacterium]|nr:(d)CMP kinase [Flavobacteriaceae bacterium]MCY4253408.1 (d)CMP kinase [Flavobacteriaceae bacterium]
MRNHSKKIIIAIDGKASTGKTTLAKRLAKHYSYAHIDTGAMYRAVTFYALKHYRKANHQIDMPRLIENIHNIHIEFKIDSFKQRCLLNGIDVDDQIRSIDVSDFVSLVSTYSPVRTYLVSLQQKIGQKKAIVMEGRDIGTVVFPKAECKIYLTANPEIRAKRRYRELIQLGHQTDFNVVLKNVIKRDYIDQSRKHSPLTKASDAIQIDVSDLNAEQVYLKSKKIVDQKL